MAPRSPYTVLEGDWLSKIALRFGFCDGGAAIWDANPDLRDKTNGNPNILRPGWQLIIPDLKPKAVQAPTESPQKITLKRHKENLRLTLRDAGNEPLKGWRFELTGYRRRLAEGKTTDQGVIDVVDFPPTVWDAELRVHDVHLFGAWKFPPEDVQLHIGGMTAVEGPNAGSMESVQRILTNLGLYDGKIDGIAGPLTRSALLSFQESAGITPLTGLADAQTVSELVKAQGNLTVQTQAAEAAAAAQRDSPLAKGDPAEDATEDVTAFSEYVEPRRPQTETARLGRFRYLPREAYVATSASGKEADNPNIIRMPARRFLFLDVGGWLGDVGQPGCARDFGVIWGRHAYLCTYDTQASGAQPPGRPGLDSEFFAGMKGRARVVRRASATWAPADAFDWETLYVILPDLHLLTAETANVWFYADQPRSSYLFGAELDFHVFVERMLAIPSLRGHLKVAQLGDLYDLWVGRPCLFTKNDRRVVELVNEQAVQTLASWVGELQASGPGDRNPTVRAFEMLESELGADHLVYVYGNHDNYLILGQVCAAAGLAPRQPWYEPPGLLMEHGHRMEDRFVGPVSIVPHNYDGVTSGHKATNGAYEGMWKKRRPDKPLLRRLYDGTVGKLDLKAIANGWAAFRDQPSYWGEDAQIWLGRQAGQELPTPHIFVIGHTHMPILRRVNINAWRNPGNPAR